MEDESPEVLQARLDSYQEQLEQIDAVLRQDPENETLTKLRQDILQVIELTSELLEVTASAEPAAPQGGMPAGMTGFLSAQDAEQKHLLGDYEAGDIVMAYFEQEVNYQPAEIDAVTSDGNFAITWLGFTSSSAEVGPDKIKPFERAEWATNDKVMAIYGSDGQWYPATIRPQADPEPGYFLCRFDKFGNEEKVRETHVKARRKTENEWKRDDKKRKLQIREIPETLKILSTDPENIKAQKKKKIKSIKSHNRSVEKDQKMNKRQQGWQSFQAKGAKRKVIGSFVGRQKESIFKTPEGDTGKVGVVGSGKEMTDFISMENQQRWRAGQGDDSD